ncbi:MAG: CopD family protein, partial [Thaumarchaeota archaeon]|nr:CopD family protein [Nitrososphaerota archaeon]
VLIITGIYNSIGFIERPSLIFSTNYGMVLLIKVILVIMLIIIFAIHVRLIRSEVERKIESKALSGEHLQKLRSKIIMLGRLTVIISIVILLMAALLHSGI